MSDNTSANTANGALGVPLMENQYVKELFDILNDNNRDSTGLSALISHVSSLEDFVKQAEGKITDMKSQLDSMKEVQNHPIKTALQNTIKALETKVAEIKVQISELKSDIIEGCKNAVAAFKDKGISALDKLASFFHIKSGLKSVSQNIDVNIKADDNAIAKIAVFSKEYHQTGRHIKNMGRVLTGKQPVDTVKEAGMLAKAVSAPYRADKRILLGMKKTVDKMAERLDQLEQNAATKREARADKPTLSVKLKENKELIRKMELEKPVPARAPKAQGLDV